MPFFSYFLDYVVPPVITAKYYQAYHYSDTVPHQVKYSKQECHKATMLVHLI
jgi:hypothetical protein